MSRTFKKIWKRGEECLNLRTKTKRYKVDKDPEERKSLINNRLVIYLVILSINLFVIGPTNKVVPMAIGRLNIQAFKNLLM